MPQRDSIGAAKLPLPPVVCRGRSQGEAGLPFLSRLQGSTLPVAHNSAVAVDAFSTEWAQAFKDEVNRSDAYRQAAKGWKWKVGLVVEAEPDHNFPKSKGIVMDLFEGEARDVRVGGADEAGACDFVITAPYSRWKQVALKELDATRGMLQGKLKLKGDLPTVVRYAKASQELTEATTRVPVRWPDE